MVDEDAVWARIQRHAGQTFQTITGLNFSYRVPGNRLRVIRDGREINRNLSRTSMMKAAAVMPVDGPGQIQDRSGAAYTWAILMDPRIRASDW